MLNYVVSAPRREIRSRDAPLPIPVVGEIWHPQTSPLVNEIDQRELNSRADKLNRQTICATSNVYEALYGLLKVNEVMKRTPTNT